LKKKEFPDKTLELSFAVDPALGEGFKFTSSAKNIDKTWNSFAATFQQMIIDGED